MNKEYQKCPVCEGRGKLPHGFYNTSEIFSSASIGDEICKTCNGQGIIRIDIEYNIITHQNNE